MANWMLGGLDEMRVVTRPYLVASVTPKLLCRFNILMWHRPEENALQHRVFRRAAFLLAENYEEKPTRYYSIVPIRFVPFIFVF